MMKFNIQLDPLILRINKNGNTQYQKYRSTSKVNITNDRVRIILTMTLNEYYKFRKQMKGEKCERCSEEYARCCS